MQFVGKVYTALNMHKGITFSQSNLKCTFVGGFYRPFEKKKINLIHTKGSMKN